MFSPIPIERFLVPATRPVVPGGFTSISEAMVNGLPHVIPLGEGLSLAVVVPSGLAATWRDIDPTVVVSSSEDEMLPPAESGSGDAPRPPARLLLRIGKSVVSSIPLAVGLRRLVPDAGDGAAGVRIAVVVLSWDIRAGSLRGPGDFGSRIALATRRADRAGDSFETPPINPQLVDRLGAEFRTESELGRATSVELSRFSNKRTVPR